MEEPSTLPLGGNPQTVRGHKWIRGILDGRTIVSSRDFLFVWEVPYWPWWFFRANDIDAELIESQDPESQNGLPDGAVAFDLVGTRGVPTHASTRWPRHGTSSSRSMVSNWPTHTSQPCSLRPELRPGSTFP